MPWDYAILLGALSGLTTRKAAVSLIEIMFQNIIKNNYTTSVIYASCDLKFFDVYSTRISDS